ncbi:hypothetical protein FTV88_0141 [Heliorestis convoluta]|uniref:Uncharacterized protein n=1 Tax=Heliorestis convoluta TaxID=356322 RepID=A0A5Q2N1U0_9FIRM|nr:hypothetical protein FTV88_0141 [Heliorestis convoluta]
MIKGNGSNCIFSKKYCNKNYLEKIWRKKFNGLKKKMASSLYFRMSKICQAKMSVIDKNSNESALVFYPDL